MTEALSWGERHQLMMIAKNADQVERAAMCMGSAPISAGTDDDKAVGIYDDDLGEFTDPLEPEWQTADESVEIAEGEALAEIEHRQRLMGLSYPFSIRNAGLHYRASKTYVYELCLATSLAPSLTRKPFNSLSPLFELVAAEAVRLHLGRDACVMRTGWPSHHEDDRPVRFREMMSGLAWITGEWNWAPQFPDSDDPDHIRVKDEGLDFVAWKRMPDTRPGKLFLLGQCACGEDWDDKLDDLSEKRLNRWFRPATAAPFQRVFAIPRPISGEYIFRELNQRAGIVFDRTRLAAIAESHPQPFLYWRDQLRQSIAMVFPEWRDGEQYASIA